MDSHPPSQILPHLIAVLHEARKKSGVTWRDFERVVEDHPFARERTNCLDLERIRDRTGEQKWPNLDDFVSCYSLVTGVEPYVLWSRALQRARHAKVSLGSAQADEATAAARTEQAQTVRKQRRQARSSKKQ